MTVQGSCFCGAISYVLAGKLRDARSCHCSMCRKAFSAQASSFALLDSQQFSWSTGIEHLRTYESKTGAGLQFCGICGSTLCGTFQGEVIGVSLGCVDGDPDIEIGVHLFVGSKARWETIPTGVLQYDEWPPKLEN
ncbi:MAG: GFA family protein [Thiohalomonadales bacterium]